MSLVIPQPNKIKVFKYGISLVHCTQIQKETSFCAYPKASLTVEAAVILPITMGFLVVLLFFFRILFVQFAIEDALIYTGRVLAVESALIEDETALYVSAEAIFKQQLYGNSDVERYVVGGVVGVSLLGSEVSKNPMLLRADCMITFPIKFFGFQGFWLSSVNQFMKWTGDINEQTIQGEWVYITETGSVYHRDTRCRSLDLSIQQGVLKEMSIYRGKKGQKYKACSRCVEKENEKDVVYFTDYGDLYHKKLTCSALKRTISKVLLTQVNGWRPCSFCYE